MISADALSVEPYGIMLPQGRRRLQEGRGWRDEPRSTRAAQINGIYEKWFLKPIPPKGINLNVPMGAAFKKVVAKPTDSPDPAMY